MQILDRFISGMKSLFNVKPNFKDECDERKGIFTLRVYSHKENRYIEEWTDNNVIVNIAKDTLAHLLGGDGTGKSILKIAVGTNNAAATPADTAITGAFTKNVTSHSYPASGQVKFEWIIDIAEANGMAIWEFGLECGDNSLFARKVRPQYPIYKDEEITVEGSWTIIL